MRHYCKVEEHTCYLRRFTGELEKNGTRKRERDREEKDVGTIIAENSSRSWVRVWPTVPAQRSFEDFGRDCCKAAERIWNDKMRMHNEGLKLESRVCQSWFT